MTSASQEGLCAIK